MTLSNYFLVFSLLGPAQDYRFTALPENLLKNTNAFVRESFVDYIMKSVSEMKVKQSIKIMILNAAGENYATIIFPHNPTSKISTINMGQFDTFEIFFKTFYNKDFGDYTNNPSAGLHVEDWVLALKPISTIDPHTVKSSSLIGEKIRRKFTY